MVAAWGFAVAGLGLFGSSAMAVDPYSIGALAILSFLTAALAWKLDGRAAPVIGCLAAFAYLYVHHPWWQDLDLVDAVRAVSGSVGIVALAVAASEVRHLLRALAQATMVDRVTQLPNRDLLRKLVQLEAYRATRHRLTFCVVALDFPELEHHSRATGYGWTEMLLMGVVDMISRTIRKSDVLGRIGGLRFALLLPMVGIDGAETAVRRLDTAMRAVPALTGQGLDLKLSAGIAAFPDDGHDADDLLALAQRRLRPVQPNQPSVSRSPNLGAGIANLGDLS